MQYHIRHYKNNTRLCHESVVGSDDRIVEFTNGGRLILGNFSVCPACAQRFFDVLVHTINAKGTLFFSYDLCDEGKTHIHYIAK